MATQWGPWEYGGGNGMRVGLDVSWSSVSHTSTSSTATIRVYVQNQYRYDDPQVMNYSGGSISGSTPYDNNNPNTPGVTFLADTKTYTWNYGSSYGGSPSTRIFTATISGAYNGVTPSVTVSSAVPGRPIARPAPPSAPVSIRNSDSQASLSWTNHATAGEPYTSITIQRRFSWNDGFVTVANLNGAPTSWVDNGLQANRQVQYQIRANNGAGSSSFAMGFTFYTTPGTPTSVSAALSGSTIVVRWTNNVRHSLFRNFVERSTAGGPWTVVASNLASNTTSWTDTSPAGGANQYRVRAKADDTPGNVGPYGGYGTSNVVSTEVPPLAPTGLAPNGQPADANSPIVLSWQHNPGADFADQTQYQVQYSADGGTTWTQVGPVTSSASSHTIPAGTLTNGQTYQWQVATKATHPSFGPWSSTATIIASSAPTVTVTAPPASVTTLPVTVTWEYQQDELSPQAQYEVRVLADGGQAGSWVVSSGSQAHTIVGVEMVDGVTFTVQVRARSGAGLWSAWDSTDFTIDLLPPALVTLIPAWDADSGTMVVGLSAAPAVPDESNPIDRLDVQRSIDGGPWRTIAAGVSLDSTSSIIDLTPTIKGVNSYRAVVKSISPSFAVTESIDRQVWGSMWGFLNWGENFALVERGAGNPKVGTAPERAGTVEAVAGRDPILLVGEQRSRKLSISMTLAWGCSAGRYGASSTPDELTAAAENADMVLWRGWDGQRVYGRLSGLQVTQGRDERAEVSFTIERAGYTERDVTTDAEAA